MSPLRNLREPTLGDRRHLAPVAVEWILRAREDRGFGFGAVWASVSRSRFLPRPGWLLFWLSRAGIADREPGSFGTELDAGA